jgi:hypothetical protein
MLLPTRHLSDDEPTLTPRNVHALMQQKAYSESTMRGAFVVQLKTAGRGSAGRMEGSVEEVDSGKQTHFRSVEELIAFLRKHFAEGCQNVRSKEGTETQ